MTRRSYTCSSTKMEGSSSVDAGSRVSMSAFRAMVSVTGSAPNEGVVPGRPTGLASARTATRETRWRMRDRTGDVSRASLMRCSLPFEDSRGRGCRVRGLLIAGSPVSPTLPEGTRSGSGGRGKRRVVIRPIALPGGDRDTRHSGKQLARAGAWRSRIAAPRPSRPAARLARDPAARAAGREGPPAAGRSRGPRRAWRGPWRGLWTSTARRHPAGVDQVADDRPRVGHADDLAGDARRAVGRIGRREAHGLRPDDQPDPRARREAWPGRRARRGSPARCGRCRRRRSSPRPRRPGSWRCPRSARRTRSRAARRSRSASPPARSGPARMTAMRSEIDIASSWSWVT